MRLNHPWRTGALSLLALGALGLMPGAARAGLTDFQTWTQVQDPPHVSFTGLATATEVTLSADGGPVPGGTDIGYQSVDGKTPGVSSLGYAFSPGADFALAIDFAITFGNSPVGYLGLGFGIGEDSDGTDSAGAALLFNNGNALGIFGAAARVDDVNQTPLALPVLASASGSMFVSYQATSGNVTLGASRTQGVSNPTGTGTFTGIQNNWDGGNLLVSFFLRSDGSLGTPWQSGTAHAVFSNLRVLSGTPLAVPAPPPLALLALGLAALAVRRRPASSAGQRRRRE
ncbi:hypothetical protein [Candidatus Thiodictyon syntrophicum]|jgi:hypothetical protein|uniref:PEP-CTERM protein-sorting domain-containing protein n=1 Tax=Candidatus Thiodictyon syntrophicum TaxID=1166950 RepID=A0A2K8UBB6_9GAMM|nr:hypothetical protein [Candidatus Thiodictyon syntrophicum]AUB82351.1 hypothetical protein THSYN_16285 [Candidatus Thiodictyon syntrophicum]